MAKKTLWERWREKLSPTPTAEGCIEWTGYRDEGGYGKISAKTVTGAHRVGYEFFNDDELTADDVVMHTCDNPPCVNPFHLKLGTQADNNKDKANKGRSSRISLKGEQNGRAEHTEEEIRTLKILGATKKFTLSKLATFFNFTSPQNVRKVVQNISWKHVEVPELSKDELDVLVDTYIDLGLEPKKGKR